MKTAIQAARADCCNFDNGRCLGATILGQRFKGLQERDRCLVLDRKPCEFFVRCVAPASGVLNDRTCPDCGGALRKHQRYCDVCAKTRRLASARKSYWKSKAT